MDEGHVVGLPKLPDKVDNRKYVFDRDSKKPTAEDKPEVPLSLTPEL